MWGYQSGKSMFKLQQNRSNNSWKWRKKRKKLKKKTLNLIKKITKHLVYWTAPLLGGKAVWHSMSANLAVSCRRHSLALFILTCRGWNNRNKKKKSARLKVQTKKYVRIYVEEIINSIQCSSQDVWKFAYKYTLLSATADVIRSTGDRRHATSICITSKYALEMTRQVVKSMLRAVSYARSWWWRLVALFKVKLNK